MTTTISPYSLLSASKLRPASVTNTYDLFSMAQAYEPASVSSHPLEPQTDTPSSDKFTKPSVLPSKKTHYVSDINKRHSAAVKTTAFTISRMP